RTVSWCRRKIRAHSRRHYFVYSRMTSFAPLWAPQRAGRRVNASHPELWQTSSLRFTRAPHHIEFGSSRFRLSRRGRSCSKRFVTNGEAAAGAPCPCCAQLCAYATPASDAAPPRNKLTSVRRGKNALTYPIAAALERRILKLRRNRDRASPVPPAS